MAAAVSFRRYFSVSGLSGTTAMLAVVLLCGMGSGITQARMLGPSRRGELAAALLWQGIIVLVGDLGLGFALSYYAGKNKSEKGQLNALITLALFSGLGIGSLVSLIGWLAVPHFVPALSGTARVSFGLSLLGAPMVLTGGFLTYILLGTGYVAEHSWIRVGTSLSYLLSVLAVAGFCSSTVRNFVLAYLVGQLTGLAIAWALVSLRFYPRFVPPWHMIKPVFSYGLKTQLASVASQANLRADQTVMTLMLPSKQLGLYVTAVAISGILIPFLNAVAVVILPRATHADDERSGALLVARHLKLASLLSLPVVVASIAAMPWVLPGFFGAQFAPAVLSAQILVVAGLFQGLNMVLGNSLRGLGRPGYPAWGEAIGMIATFALLLALLPSLGILGAAISSLIAYFLVSLVQFFLLGRTAGISVISLLTAPFGSELTLLSSQLMRKLGRQRA